MRCNNFHTGRENAARRTDTLNTVHWKKVLPNNCAYSFLNGPLPTGPTTNSPPPATSTLPPTTIPMTTPTVTDVFTTTSHIHTDNPTGPAPPTPLTTIHYDYIFTTGPAIHDYFTDPPTSSLPTTGQPTFTTPHPTGELSCVHSYLSLNLGNKFKFFGVKQWIDSEPSNSGLIRGSFRLLTFDPAGLWAPMKSGRSQKLILGYSVEFSSLKSTVFFLHVN